MPKKIFLLLRENRQFLFRKESELQQNLNLRQNSIIRASPFVEALIFRQVLLEYSAKLCHSREHYRESRTVEPWRNGSLGRNIAKFCGLHLMFYKSNILSCNFKSIYFNGDYFMNKKRSKHKMFFMHAKVYFD